MSLFSIPFSLWVASKLWKTAILPLVLRRDGSFKRHISDFLDRTVTASDTPVSGVYTRDVTIDPETDLWVRIFVPDKPEKLPLIFYFHGGFFAFYTPSSVQFDTYCRRISRECNAVVISVNYRRIPEHRYPSAIEDGLTVIKWFKDNHEKLPKQADVCNTFVAGDSAGANLVHNLSYKLTDNIKGPLVFKGFVLVQPSFGGKVETSSEALLGDGSFADKRFSEWRWKAYLPEGADKDHPACNPFGNDSPDLSEIEIPSVLMVIGGFCPGQDRQREYVERMKASGKEVECVFFSEAVHGFFLFPMLKVTSKFHTKLAKYIQSRVSF